ncbi:hypothetical protein RND61_21140 [Streptomyces sp. TRM76323]|uniref:Large membrane protein n=1 Tax=Streptomyces tamarix TaxID=3078565 RepID=A0ABU3QP67_9ACTN|nr:hypothetical protein [Streptomyces tamarix]MDT9684541.1 hypothetical protein [Streptomyces tamarix]
MSETENSTDTGPGRRRRPFAVALVAAAVLAAGGGTYLAVDRSGGGTAAAPAEGRGAGPALSPSPGGTSPGVAPGEPDPGGDDPYRLVGTLPKAPETAHAYRMRVKVTEADVARLAKALNVPGTPVKGPVGWRVGPRHSEGLGHSLDVYEGGEWRYEAQGPLTDNCPRGKRCKADPTDRPVSDEEARRAAAPLMKALGLADADVTLATSGADRLVTAAPRVGGLPTRDWETVFTVDDGEGVTYAEGRLAAFVRGGTYPVISAEQALGELNETVRAMWPRGGTGDCATPAPLDGTGAAKERAGADPSGPCEPRTDLPKSPKESVTTIRTVTLGLSGVTGKTGETLAPSWLFEGERDGKPHRFDYPAVPLERLFPKPEKPEAMWSEPYVEPYAPQDRRLRLSFGGGACSSYLVRVEETATQVRLRLFEIPDGAGACPSIALSVSATVVLEEPVGDRAVVSAVTGKPLPRQKGATR